MCSPPLTFALVCAYLRLFARICAPFALKIYARFGDLLVLAIEVEKRSFWRILLVLG